MIFKFSHFKRPIKILIIEIAVCDNKIGIKLADRNLNLFHFISPHIMDSKKIIEGI